MPSASTPPADRHRPCSKRRKHKTRSYVRRHGPGKPNNPTADVYLAAAPTARLAKRCEVLAIVVEHVVPRVDPVVLVAGHPGDFHGVLLGGRGIVVVLDDLEVGGSVKIFFHADLRRWIRV